MVMVTDRHTTGNTSTHRPLRSVSTDVEIAQPFSVISMTMFRTSLWQWRGRASRRNVHRPSKTMHESIKFIQAGVCRNAPEARTSHTYADNGNGLWPMCGYGWNRSDGEAFSIFRSAPGTEGDCKLCRKNLRNNKPPTTDGWPHKTRWL